MLCLSVVRPTLADVLCPSLALFFWGAEAAAAGGGDDDEGGLCTVRMPAAAILAKDGFSRWVSLFDDAMTQVVAVMKNL